MVSPPLLLVSTVLFIISHSCSIVKAEVTASPELTNLATGREFEASSTCGQSGPEEHCYAEVNGVLVPTSDCFTCDNSSPLTSRGVENINDEETLENQTPSGDEENGTQMDDGGDLSNRTWWQSASGESDVTLELKFERGFDLYHIEVDFRSLRPASGVLETSTNFGDSYKPVQYYSDKCLEDFGIAESESPGMMASDNGVAGCTSNYTSPSPGPLLFEVDESPLATVTNVRLRLLRFNTPPEDLGLDGNMLQHYAIYDFQVLGLCLCTQVDSVCVCEEEVPVITTPPTPVCDLPGVTGKACDTCLTGYYNFSESTGCQPCNCNPKGTLDSICDAESGQCICANGVTGPTCDQCPPGSIGPSKFTETPCTSCFCNGYSMTCESAEGWYQAKVDYRDLERSNLGFKSNGMIRNYSSDFLEVEPSAVSSRSLILSFPKDYLGDKRTAYNQRLAMSISLPYLNNSKSSDLTACLEIVGQTVRYPQVRIIWPLKADELGAEPQLIEVPLVAGKADLVPYFTLARGRLAMTKDIREVMTDIRMMRLVISSKLQDPHGLTLRLHSLHLPFAVRDRNSSFALQPPQSVSYVERCSQCPSTRTGDNCDRCTEGHTIDPGNGGEFARCVECFCNFFSDTCHPMSGECSNCLGNTFGVDCELCLPGYLRAMPLTLLPCDQCADGYWDAGSNGSCVPCSCIPDGSLSNNCDKSTGVCECREGVVGDLCDACAPNTSQVFPSCMPCDECTDQWIRRITPLEEQVQGTIEFATSLNLSNTTLDIPLLDALFELAGDIEMVLGNSSIDSLTSDVDGFVNRLCLLVNQTEDLITRGELVQKELDRIGMDSEEIEMSLLILTNSLTGLRGDLENVTMIFESQEFNTSLNSTFYANLARKARERSDMADQLVEGNITILLNKTISALETFNATFEENDVTGINDRLQQALANINSTVSEMQAFIAVASARLCGSGDEVCSDCADSVSCEVCPNGIRCNGLIATADLAYNISEQALVVAEELLDQVADEIRTLEELLERAQEVQRGANEVGDFVAEIWNTSLELFENVTSLVAELERELNASRVDPDNIERLENMTLSLQLDLLPEEFFDLLVEINATIDAFFAGSGVSELELRERLEAALRRAERASDLASEITANATALRQQISELTAEQRELELSVNQTTFFVEEIEDTIEQAEVLLGMTEASLNSSRDILTNISERLLALEQQIDQNEVGLVEARNLTTVAQQVASEVQNASSVVEEEFIELRDEALAKLDQSERDLEAALDIKNRTLTLQQLTQQQLLDVESFDRIKNALFTEQEMIQGGVARVVNEIEELEAEIQGHVTRNTGCLDSPVLSKRKRKKRSPRRSRKNSV